MPCGYFLNIDLKTTFCLAKERPSALNKSILNEKSTTPSVFNAQTMTSLLVDPQLPMLFLLTFWLNAKAREAEKLSEDNFSRGDKSECSHNDGFDVIKLFCGLEDESGFGCLFWKAKKNLDPRLMNGRRLLFKLVNSDLNFMN